MNAQYQLAVGPTDSPPLPTSSSVWHPATRVAFRFCLVYLGLYILMTQLMLGTLIPLPAYELPELGTLPPFRTVVMSVANHLFGVSSSLVVTGSGSGDKIFDWVQVFCFLAIAVVAMSAWTLLDRKRKNYVDLHNWFRLFVRLTLGSTMVIYGASKAVPLQMGYGPSLTRLVEPYGNFSPMGVLWSFVGASPTYQSFIGCAELIGGILLFLPRTTTLGALVCLADAVHVFTLNMTYDVPVKLLSFHLILFSLFLLAPDGSRLANVFLLNRTASPSSQPPLARGRRGRRIALAAQVCFGVYVIAVSFYSVRRQWGQYGGGSPRSPLYGIWNVEQMSVDDQTRPPLLTDDGRWRRIIFDFPFLMTFQRMNDSFFWYGATIDQNLKSITLTNSSDKNWKATFSFERPAADRLVLEGEMDGRKVRMQLVLLEREKFRLMNRGFHWVQEYPFNQ